MTPHKAEKRLMAGLLNINGAQKLIFVLVKGLPFSVRFLGGAGILALGHNGSIPHQSGSVARFN